MPAIRQVDNALGVPSPNSLAQPIQENEIFVSSGSYIIYITTDDITGSFDDGAEIRNAANPSSANIFGDIVQSIAYADPIYGNVRKIVYNLQPESGVNNL